MKKIFEKKYHNAEKTERGPFGIFEHPFSRETPKSLRGGPFGKKLFPKKVSQCRKN